MESEVKLLLKRAKKAPKGDYFIYEQFKQELMQICKTNTEYSEAVVALADALRI